MNLKSLTFSLPNLVKKLDVLYGFVKLKMGKNLMQDLWEVLKIEKFGMKMEKVILEKCLLLDIKN